MGPWGSGVVWVAIAAVVLVVVLEDCSGPAPYVPDAARGRALFVEKAMCRSCHTLDGRGGQNAPDLDHVGTKFIKLKGGREQARKFFHDHLVDPKGNPGTDKAKYPFTDMPTFLPGLGEEGIADVCEYLLTLE